MMMGLTRYTMRVGDGNNLKWKHLPKCDLLNLDRDSILDCNIKRGWNINNERPTIFH